MTQRFITIVVDLLRKFTGKKFLYITPSQYNALGRTAAWCDFGFWYVGNVYDRTDIAYGIAQNGMVEKEDTKLVDVILSKLRTESNDLTFYDIGANTGYYGLLAATKFGADVHSFEPLDEHTTCIRESARINGVADKVTVHTMALGSRKDSLEITIAGSGSTLTKDFLGKNDSPVRVVAIETLDSLNLPVPHFLKIDVEGYEWEVLQGAQETITCHKPICFVEIAKTFHARNFINKNFENIVAYFVDHGYQAFLHLNGQLVSIEKTPIPDGVHMYLFVPAHFDL